MKPLFLALIFMFFYSGKGLESPYADVVEIKTSGNEGAYTFHVTLRSPDTGCGQYANWWEVISPEGDLIYRRILGHSHVDEQPFTRSGGEITISMDQVVIVRAHMNNLGYGGKAMTGTVKDGFRYKELEKSFAIKLEKVEPLPDGCAF